jgi:uncharacterized repeat protein (TIGR03899 family)
MTKIQSLSGHQRLLQLARRQLGHAVRSNVSTETSVDQVHLSGKEPKPIQEHVVEKSTESEVTDSLLLRAQRRAQMKLERQQFNLERVLLLAQEFCTDQIVANEIDPDWFHQFSELVQDISTHSMQKLWAKILAGEISQPGSFSFKTLMLLRQMSFKDAQSLQAAASLSCRNKSAEPSHIYFGYVQRGSFWRWIRGKNRGMLNLSQFGLTYPQILNLMDLGLLHQSEIESGELIKGKPFQWLYHQQCLEGIVQHHGIVLQYYKFTATGAELLPLLSSSPQPLYSQALQTLLNEVVTFAPQA